MGDTGREKAQARPFCTRARLCEECVERRIGLAEQQRDDSALLDEQQCAVVCVVLRRDRLEHLAGGADARDVSVGEPARDEGEDAGGEGGAPLAGGLGPTLGNVWPVDDGGSLRRRALVEKFGQVFPIQLLR